MHVEARPPPSRCARSPRISISGLSTTTLARAARAKTCPLTPILDHDTDFGALSVLECAKADASLPHLPQAARRLLMAADISTKVHMHTVNGFENISKDVLVDAECLSDASCDNFWISCGDLERGRSLCFIEALICWIHGHMMKEHVGVHFAGVEYWVQVRVMSSSRNT